jgi:hypothetical protein
LKYPFCGFKSQKPPIFDPFWGMLQRSKNNMVEWYIMMSHFLNHHYIHEYRREMKMKTTGISIAFILMALSLSGTAVAQELYVYPAKGQSQEQLEQDKFNCYTWAKKQTGFDPMQVPEATSPPAQKASPTTSPVRGAARGAAVGAIGGAIAGDTGKGAAIGAASGALIGGMRRRDQIRHQQQAEQQWAEQQASDYQNRRNEYNRAYAACLEAKGYTVN